MDPISLIAGGLIIYAVLKDKGPPAVAPGSETTGTAPRPGIEDVRVRTPDIQVAPPPPSTNGGPTRPVGAGESVAPVSPNPRPPLPGGSGVTPTPTTAPLPSRTSSYVTDMRDQLRNAANAVLGSGSTGGKQTSGLPPKRMF